MNSLCPMLMFLFFLRSVPASTAAQFPRVHLQQINAGVDLAQVDVADIGETVVTNLDGKICRSVDPATSSHSMFFQLNDSYFYDSQYSYESVLKDCEIAHIAIVYYDGGTDPFSLYYDGVSNAYQQIEVQRTDSRKWQWKVFDLPDARFSNRQQSTFDFRLTVKRYAGDDPLFVDRVYVWCRKESEGVVHITEENPQQFTLNDERFVMTGANWFPDWVADRMSHEERWMDEYYDSEIVERDLAEMELAGCNATRVFYGFYDYSVSGGSGVQTEPLVNLKDFLQRAENHGIKVTVSTFGRTSWLTWMLKNDSDFQGAPQVGELFCNTYYQTVYADWLVNLINEGELFLYDSFFAIDVLNEMKFAQREDLDEDGSRYDDFDASLTVVSNQSDAVFRAWNCWVGENYGTPENAYEVWLYQGSNDTASLVFPPSGAQFVNPGGWHLKVNDYYDFISDSVEQTVSYIKDCMVAGVTGRVPFVTLDLTSNSSQGESLTADIRSVLALNTDIHRLAHVGDFSSLHIYPGYSSVDDEFWDDLLVRLFLMNSGKPVVLSEFGMWSYNFYLNENAEELQQSVWENLMNLASQAKMDGVLGWMWRDGLYLLSDTTLDAETRSQGAYGIVRTNGTHKGAYDEFAQIKASLLMQQEPVSDVAILVDRRAYVSPLELFYSAANNLVEDLLATNMYPSFVDRADESLLASTIYELPKNYTNVQMAVNVPDDVLPGGFGAGSGNGAVKVSIDLPRVLIAGLDYTGTIKMRNIGTNVWQTGYGLGTPGTCDWPYQRWWVDFEDPVFTSEEVSFEIGMNFASTGSHLIVWQMLENGNEWFGEDVVQDLCVIEPPMHGARFEDNSLPDRVASSTQFNVTLTVRNEGAATWSSGYKLVPVWLENGGPHFYSTNGIALTTQDTVVPGDSKTFSLTFTSPTVNVMSHRRTCWQMQDPQGNLFGQRFEKDIVVTD